MEKSHSFLRKFFQHSEDGGNENQSSSICNENAENHNETHNSSGSQSEGCCNESESDNKIKIYNLIIVDESGSMTSLRNVTLSGINETLNTIREAQKEHNDVQKHYISLVTFDDRGESTPAIRTIIDAQPAESVGEFTKYNPTGCTPLYDAIGDSLTKLHNRIYNDENATAVVTILTDGLENSSQQWDADQVRRLIDKLKEDGWTFSYMGSDHNVKEVSDLLSIDNVIEFSHDEQGAYDTWGRERSSKRAYYEKMALEYESTDTWEEKKAKRRRYNSEYYSNRVTPENLRCLDPHEVFVFGSNAEGIHNGGAAKIALHYFGAKLGKGEGIQGRSYAIPTTNGIKLLQDAVNRFCKFAASHPREKFYVTRIGCGNAGYSPREIAPLFRQAIELENVALPQDFWEVLGLRMF